MATQTDYALRAQLHEGRPAPKDWHQRSVAKTRERWASKLGRRRRWFR